MASAQLIPVETAANTAKNVADIILHKLPPDTNYMSESLWRAMTNSVYYTDPFRTVRLHNEENKRDIDTLVNTCYQNHDLNPELRGAIEASFILFFEPEGFWAYLLPHYDYDTHKDETRLKAAHSIFEAFFRIPAGLLDPEYSVEYLQNLHKRSAAKLLRPAQEELVAAAIYMMILFLRSIVGRNGSLMEAMFEFFRTEQMLDFLSGRTGFRSSRMEKAILRYLNEDDVVRNDLVEHIWALSIAQIIKKKEEQRKAEARAHSANMSELFKSVDVSRMIEDLRPLMIDLKATLLDEEEDWKTHAPEMWEPGVYGTELGEGSYFYC